MKILKNQLYRDPEDEGQEQGGDNDDLPTFEHDDPIIKGGGDPIPEVE